MLVEQVDYGTRRLGVADVEARLVEAFEMLGRIPDRERGQLAGGVSAIWRMAMREWGDYSPDTEMNRSPTHLSVVEVARMEQALAWCRWLVPEQRRIVSVVIPMRVVGYAQIGWGDVRRRLRFTIRAEAVRMRYRRALLLITDRVNNGETPPD